MASLSPMTRRLSSDLNDVKEGLKIAYSTPCYTSKKGIGVVQVNDNLTKTKMSRTIGLYREGDSLNKSENFWTKMKGSCRKVSVPVCHATDSDATENHQKSVHAYFEKLQGQGEQVSSETQTDFCELEDQARRELQSLDRYISILKEDGKPDDYSPSSAVRNLSGMTQNSALEYTKIIQQKKRNFCASKSKTSALSGEKNSTVLYFISILISMNVAVFLFEIASPIKNSENNLYSLPLMYGAKVNDLIMVGEWWRLLTPMFLHAGFLHVALSSWMLLSFGPQVCKEYGVLTFFLIYLLGGISGNLISFVHTSEPTIGGSGPVFAIVGAWLIYQIQNKDVLGKDTVEGMFQKAIIATALSFLLSNFGLIDNWTSLGAAVSGIIYGFFTCPVVQVDDTTDTSFGNAVNEEITISRQSATPCKSLLIFTLFVSALSSLIFLAESPLEPLELEELINMV